MRCANKLFCSSCHSASISFLLDERYYDVRAIDHFQFDSNILLPVPTCEIFASNCEHWIARVSVVNLRITHIWQTRWIECNMQKYETSPDPRQISQNHRTQNTFDFLKRFIRSHFSSSFSPAHTSWGFRLPTRGFQKRNPSKWYTMEWKWCWYGDGKSERQQGIKMKIASSSWRNSWNVRPTNNGKTSGRERGREQRRTRKKKTQNVVRIGTKRRAEKHDTR